MKSYQIANKAKGSYCLDQDQNNEDQVPVKRFFMISKKPDHNPEHNNFMNLD